jgi:hypothetical protein
MICLARALKLLPIMFVIIIMMWVSWNGMTTSWLLRMDLAFTCGIFGTVVAKCPFINSNMGDILPAWSFAQRKETSSQLVEPMAFISGTSNLAVSEQPFLLRGYCLWHLLVTVPQQTRGLIWQGYHGDLVTCSSSPATSQIGVHTKYWWSSRWKYSVIGSVPWHWMCCFLAS